MKHTARIAAFVLLFGMALGAATAQPEPFTNWHQGFESGTDGWITDSTPGAEGWCGDIEHHDASSGPVDPSEGEGYAVARNGVCNDYWQENGFDRSGPFSPGAGYPRAWPDAGYTAELDVYLDTEAGTEFTLAGSVVLLDPEDPDNPFRYFFVEATPDGNSVAILGHDVGEQGWYTLRYTFGDDDGALTVNAEMLRDGEVVASEPLTTTAYTEEAASSFDVTELGSGYMWFVSIGEDMDLAIDEHRVRSNN